LKERALIHSLKGGGDGKKKNGGRGKVAKSGVVGEKQSERMGKKIASEGKGRRGEKK